MTNENLRITVDSELCLTRGYNFNDLYLRTLIYRSTVYDNKKLLYNINKNKIF